MIGLRKLDVVVGHDLYAITPGVVKIESLVEKLHSGLNERTAYSLAVIDDESEMTLTIRFLGPVFAKLNKLISQVDESATLDPAPQLEFQNCAVELKCLIDAADLQHHVVDTERPGLDALIGHDFPRCPNRS